MKEKYIVTVNNTPENEYFRDAITSTKKVRAFLDEKYNKKFSFTDATNAEWSMFWIDYQEKSEDVEFLSKISEDFIDKELVFNAKNEKRVDESVSNSIFYYPKYEVALVSLYNFAGTGIRNSEYVFFADPKKYMEFYEEAEKRSRMVDDKEIIVFTDSSSGVQYGRQTVNELIDREKVVLEKKVKEDIYESIDQFFKENEEFYKKYNIPHKRGILLYGEPGNGKTTLVKSLVGTIDSPVVYWQINEFTNSESVRTVFDTAANMAPVVLVIEDLDSLPPSTRSTFLNTLDGATTKEGTFLIGTTNYPERIDKALINRVGRFDRTYEIKLPSEELRIEYLKTRGILDFMDESQVNDIASKTEGFSFVQLSEIFRQIAYAAYHNKQYDADDIISVLKENNHKSAKNTWNSKDEKTVGFSK